MKYLLAAAVLTTAPAFHVGDTVQIETWLLNARSDKNFLGDSASVRRYVAAQLPKGTLGEIEQLHSFSGGNVGLYIKVASGPNAGKKYWVLHRPGRNYLKLYDRKDRETAAPEMAATAQATRDLSAVQDREPQRALAVQQTDAPTLAESEIPERVLDLSQFVKSAGVAPETGCQNLPVVAVTATPRATVSSEVAASAEFAKYLKPTERVQSQSAQVRSLALKITEGLNDNSQKALAIHDWVAANVHYDARAYFQEYQKKLPWTRSYDALEVLNSAPRTAVCGGYSYLTAALLRASNIPTRVVEGNLDLDVPPTSDSCKDKARNHAWVEAWVDGKWLSIDTSADAGTVDLVTETFTPKPSQRFMDPFRFKVSHVKCLETAF